jgi:hypothetical protein
MTMCDEHEMDETGFACLHCRFDDIEAMCARIAELEAALQTSREMYTSARERAAAQRPVAFVVVRGEDGVMTDAQICGLMVAGRSADRAEVERWFAEASRAYFAAQYLAVLRLFDREATGITKESTE